jgi:hypothetical protein
VDNTATLTSLPSQAEEIADVIKQTFADELEADINSIAEGELKSVIVIMRHGDRKPKEKLKFKTCHPLFLHYIYHGNREDFPIAGMPSSRGNTSGEETKDR